MSTVWDSDAFANGTHVSGHPYTTPRLQADMVLRIIFAFLANFCMWVPLKLLWRNAEFPAACLIVNNMFFNMMTAVNAMIWQNDDLASWYDGTGMCDIQVYIRTPLETLYAASICAIIWKIAYQVSNLRATQLTRREKRNRMFIEAVAVFAVPLVQVVITWFVLDNRFYVMTVVGCFPKINNSWPVTVFFNIPPALFALASSPAAVICFLRYKRFANMTSAAHFNNSTAASRAAKRRYRLYLMCMSILVPYVPAEIAFLIRNTLSTTNPFGAFDYNQVHFHPDSPFPWNTIFFVPSWEVPWEVMFQPWIPIITTAPIMFFYGMTEDAMKAYREIAVRVGLARWFPSLLEPYNPNRRYYERADGGTENLSWSQRFVKYIRCAHENDDEPEDVPLNRVPQLPQIPLISPMPLISPGMAHGHAQGTAGGPARGQVQGYARGQSPTQSPTEQWPLQINGIQRPPDLPNVHHQAIVNTSGPAIPPRHSSKGWRGILSPSATWRKISAKLPSLPSLPSSFSTKRKKNPEPDHEANVSIASSHRSGRSVHPDGHVRNYSYNFRHSAGSSSANSESQILNPSELPPPPPTSNSPSTYGRTLYMPSSMDGREVSDEQEVVPRDMIEPQEGDSFTTYTHSEFSHPSEVFGGTLPRGRSLPERMANRSRGRAMDMRGNNGGPSGTNGNANGNANANGFNGFHRVRVIRGNGGATGQAGSAGPPADLERQAWSQ